MKVSLFTLPASVRVELGENDVHSYSYSIYNYAKSYFRVITTSYWLEDRQLYRGTTVLSRDVTMPIRFTINVAVAWIEDGIYVHWPVDQESVLVPSRAVFEWKLVRGGHTT